MAKTAAAAKKAPVAAKKTAAKAAPAAAEKATPAAATGYKVDDLVEFTGYSDPTITDDQKILVPGQILRITVVPTQPDDGYQAVVHGTPEGEPVVGDTVFDDEVKAAPTTKKAAAVAAKTVKENTPPVTKSDAKAAKSVAKAKETPVVPPEPTTKAGKAKAAKNAEKQAAEASAPPQAAQRVVEGQVVQIQDSPAVAAVLSGQDALAAAKMLVERSEETYFTLGGVLNHIYTEGTHKLAGFDGKRGFADYVEKELGVAYRKAMYLIKIYAYFRSLGVDESRLAEIGWSKAKELVGKVGKDAFDAVVDYASEHSRDELISYIETNQTSAGDGTASEKVEKKRFTFILFGDQAAGVERALAAAQTELEGDVANKLSLAFELIVTEWSMSKENVEVSIEDAVAALKARFSDEEIDAALGITSEEPEAGEEQTA